MGSVRTSAPKVVCRCGQLLQRLYSEDQEGGAKRLSVDGHTTAEVWFW